MYLLDTNHCSLILLKEPIIIQHIERVGEANIATSIISAGELIYMAENSRNQAENLALIQQFLSDIRVYYISDQTASIYGSVKASLIKQFGPQQKTKRQTTKITQLGFDENDLWIASIAKCYDLTLITADSDFVRMQTVIDFSLENWRQQ